MYFLWTEVFLITVKYFTKKQKHIIYVVQFLQPIYVIWDRQSVYITIILLNVSTHCILMESMQLQVSCPLKERKQLIL